MICVYCKEKKDRPLVPYGPLYIHRDCIDRYLIQVQVEDSTKVEKVLSLQELAEVFGKALDASISETVLNLMQQGKCILDPRPVNPEDLKHD